ncbi:MAG: LPS export ABC transporter ATP-binding protein, partial [Candidatus Aminicenantes bacterium]|nr:LPS export ABC transporter ATP-binding protein [Candidatus Aminicenantes bacterium]
MTDKPRTLKAVGLVKRYGRKKVVDRVTVEVRGGEVVGLLGPNGAGKTTTFSIILGLVESDEGKVLLGNEDLTEVPMYLRARRGVSLLPQEPSSFRRLSVEANLRSVVRRRRSAGTGRRNVAAAMLREVGLDGLARAKAYTLSGGERRRLEIARALATDPSFILLDEPFTGIDPIAIQDLQSVVGRLKAQGLGVLITDHNVIDTLRIVDRAYIIDRGRILEEGPPERVVASPEVRRR